MTRYPLRLAGPALVVALAVAGCSEQITPIRDIVAAPGGFDGKQVTIQGRVTATTELRSSGGTGYRAYGLRDSTGEMTVVAQGAVPPSGAEVKVRGTVEVPPPVGSLAVGPRLRESPKGSR
jgi:hypothetical protein